MSVFLSINFVSTELGEPKPWPLIVEVADATFPEIVSGRPDAGRLAAFHHPSDPTAASPVSVWGWELADPARRADAIGLCPSYIAIEGGMFALPYVVVGSITEYDATPEMAATLRAREVEYRLAALRVGL